jgi:tetratricopeptide (TPR) repeat protein
VETITDCDAVVLFVERARAVKATFTLDASNAEAVAQVCRRLDGIALAIELAAARVAVLTPADLARRLDSRFRLLAGGQRTAVERHQTLRAAIDWSYELLDANEQLILARLSVFAGGFSLDAAEAVTASAPIAAVDVFELLAVLVARSLVVADTEGVDARYRLLETIRQYAQEHLDDSGDGDRLRAAHAAYFAGFAEVAIPNIVGPDGIEWEQRFKREYDNVRGALTWAADTGDVDLALRLLSMWDTPYLLNDAGVVSTVTWACDTALAIPEAAEHPRYPAALTTAGMMAWAQGAQELAQRRCEEALAAEQRLGTEPNIVVWTTLADVALAQGRADLAVEHARRAVELGRDRSEPTRLAGALSTSALAHTMFGDPAAALRDAEEILVVTRRLANPHVVVGSLARAAFAMADSEPQRALALAREAVARIGPGGRSMVWAIAGDLAARNGEQREALALFAKAIDDAHWLALRVPLGVILARVAILLNDRDLEAAAVLQGAGDTITPGYAHARHHLEAQEQAIATIDASLGATRRHELHAQGAAMSDTDAVNYAKDAIARNLAQQRT